MELPAALKAAGAAGLANVLAVAPAAAKEAGKIFDFDLTLPLIAGQFLILMVILDKLVYGPVGDVLESRDDDLKAKLSGVKDGAGDIEGIMAEASKVVADARNEVQEKVNAAKKAGEESNAAKYAEAKAKMDKELASALAQLDSAMAASMADLEKEAESLANDIVKKACPVEA